MRGISSEWITCDGPPRAFTFRLLLSPLVVAVPLLCCSSAPSVPCSRLRLIDVPNGRIDQILRARLRDSTFTILLRDCETARLRDCKTAIFRSLVASLMCVSQIRHLYSSSLGAASICDIHHRVSISSHAYQATHAICQQQQQQRWRSWAETSLIALRPLSPGAKLQ